MTARETVRQMLSEVGARVRARQAAEAAFMSAALALGCLDLFAGVWVHGLGRSAAGMRAVGFGGCAVVAGVAALIAGWRRPGDDACARLVDRCLPEPAADRVRGVAGWLASSPGPMGELAIEDAARALAGVSPARVIPWRTPQATRFLVAFWIGAVALTTGARPGAGAGAGTRAGASVGARDARTAKVVKDAVLLARSAADSAARVARETRDGELETLAQRLRGLAHMAETSQLNDAQTRATLDALAAETESAARGAQASADAVAAVARALGRGASGRALAEAMTGRGSGSGAAPQSAAERQALADALERAAQTLSEQTGGPGEAGDRTAPAEPQRRLEQLRRDLEDAAASCRRDPAACRRDTQKAAESGAQASQAGRGAEERRALGEATRELGNSLAGETKDTPAEAAGRASLERAARGESSGATGDERAAGGSAQGTGGERRTEPGQAPGATPGAAAASGLSQSAPGSTGAGVARGGTGVGDEAGGDPRGKRTAATPGGHEAEVHPLDGPGPSRSEVIEAGASRGFARADYRRVFGEYRAVAEDALVEDRTPVGRRSLVRRYFDLIRPR